MALYQAVLAYDGTEFLGFQRQSKGRTVQGEVERALRRLGWTEKSILAAGRTDSGVHARGQGIAFDLDWRHDEASLLRALNSLLPPDVVVRKIRFAPEGFHPRYDALARRYVYRLFFAPVRNPFAERFAWRVWPSADEKLLAQAAALLPGRRDFSAFGTPPLPNGTTIRTVRLARWHQIAPNVWAFEVAADAFLYRMVRRMVGLQVLIGQGRRSLEELEQALEKPPVAPLAVLAPPNGLFLESVCYTPEEVERCKSAEVTVQDLFL